MTEVENDNTLRLGLRGLKGITESVAVRIVQERATKPYVSLEDFLTRVRPNAKEKRILAQAGALNELPEVEHRRQALWQVELPLYDDLLIPRHPNCQGVLPPMSPAERLSADFLTQGASTGPHPLALWREHSGARHILRATDLHNLPHGIPVTVAGMAICRQRPGTAKGHCFISLEDETGIANLFVPKPTFHRLRRVISGEPFLLADGILQRSEGDQPTVYVLHIEPLNGTEPEHAARSHDFH